MRSAMIGAALLATACQLGCGPKGSSQPSQSPAPQPANATDAAAPQPDKGSGQVDTKDLPREGAGDAALTYDLVNKNPAQHRGKRATWSFAPCSSDGKRMMCALNMNDAMGPRHYGIYVVEFASEKEAGDAFNAAAFKSGSTLTGTIAGEVDQFLVVRDAAGAAQKDIPKVTVPLLFFPTYSTAGN